MLAYVFWHWKRTSVQPRDYEHRLQQFHRALNNAPPDGFESSWAASVSKAPWANAGGDAYEDWYLVKNSAALDPLNEAAITASRQLPHDEAAAVAASGTAGLYRLREGSAGRAPRQAMWFAKPDGWSYSRLYEALLPVMNRDRGLWGRQMTLGPALEFCLHASDVVELPDGIRAHSIALRSVFPERA